MGSKCIRHLSSFRLHLIRSTLYFCVLFVCCCCRQFVQDSEQMTKNNKWEKREKVNYYLFIIKYSVWSRLFTPSMNEIIGIIWTGTRNFLWLRVCIWRFGWDRNAVHWTIFGRNRRRNFRVQGKSFWVTAIFIQQVRNYNWFVNFTLIVAISLSIK